MALARRVMVPTVVGVLALLLGGVLAYVTVRDVVDDDGEAGAASPAAQIETDTFVSRTGGFRVQVPTDLDVQRKGRTAQLVSKDKDLVVNVGPGEPGPLKVASRQFVETLEGGYRRLEVLGSQRDTVDGRPALTVYGQAVNANRTRIRFVVLTVQARPRNYTIAAYTSYGSDPRKVLPRVNAVANGFEVLDRRGR